MSTMIAPSGGQPKQTNMRSIARVVLATLAILLLPAGAMLVTEEVNWGPGDFLVAAALLGGTGLLLEFAVTKLKTRKARIIAGGAVLLAMLLVWAELAVGIIGSPIAGS